MKNKLSTFTGALAILVLLSFSGCLHSGGGVSGSDNKSNTAVTHQKIHPLGGKYNLEPADIQSTPEKQTEKQSKQQQNHHHPKWDEGN